MKSIVIRLGLFVLAPILLNLPVFGQAAKQEILFLETFEGTNALSHWQIQTGSAGRVGITADSRATNNHGLLMDDGTNDVTFSQNIARRSVSIAGYTGIRVAVDVYSFDDEVHYEGGFDGVVLRVGNLSRKYGMEWVQEKRFDIPLDFELANVAATNGMLTIELHQYDNFSVPDDGLFFDNVTVTGIENRQIYAEAPLIVSEAEPFVVTVLLSPIPSQPVELRLLRLGDFSTPAHGTAIYPAGAASAELTFPSFNNARLDGDWIQGLSISDGFFTSLPFFPRIQDDERAGLGMTVPGQVAEGVSENGTVLISASHESWITVYLRSSDPAVLTVPESVTMSAFVNSASFPITTREDRRILADREVTITASIGAERVEKRVTVTEMNSLMPVLSGPTNIVEGATEIPYTLTLNGISDQPLTVTLSATPASVSIQPTNVTLAAGDSAASFKVSVAEDSLAQGDYSFAISAQTIPGLKGTLSGKVLDNEIAGFAFDLPDRIEADAVYTVQVRAVNQNGTTVGAFNGRANLYQRDSTTGAEQLLQENLAFSQGEATVLFGLPYSARGDLFVVRSADGVTTVSKPLVMFAKLAFAAHDLVYDPKRQVLYAVSGGSATPGHLHSVTTITPGTGQIGPTLFLGGDPRNVIITDDEKYLYVGQHSSYAVRRIDLDTFTSVATIVLDADSVWAGNSFTPYRMLAIPGRPLDFIASQNHTTSSYRTTRLYINGVVQPSSSWDAVELAAAGSPNEFYAFNSGSSSYDFMRLRLNATGFEVVSSKRESLLSGYQSQIAGENDLVFSSSGRVIDGLKMEIVADVRFPSSWVNSSNPWEVPPTPVVPDLARSRVFYARRNAIAAYDTGVYQLVTDVSLPGTGNITKIVRWGETGFALLTDRAEVILMEDDELIPTGPATDLAVTIAAAPQPVYVSDDLTYSITVTNLSDTVARDVRLSIDLTPGQSIKAVSTGAFPNAVQSSNVVIQIGEMAPGARHQFSITTVPTAVATLVGTAGLATRSLDRNYANNKAAVALNVGFKSNPNSVNVVKMPINDVLLEPNSGQLIVSIGATAPSGIANRIVALDPASGLITRSIPTPGEPARLAVSEDGTTVYALSAARNTAFKIHLPTEQFVRTISFSTPSDNIYASDIKVLRGTTDSIIIGSGWYGARVYDNGVARPQNSGTYDGNLVVLLPDPNLVFGFNTEHSGHESFKYEISANGVRTLVETGGLFHGFFQQMKGDGYFVYGLDGKAVRADLMTIAGTFPLSVFPGNGSSPLSVEPDRAGQRVYFARDKVVASFDSEAYLHIRSVSFDLPANMLSLERWGTDGFAARLENGELAIIRTDLVSQAPSAIDFLVSVEDNLQVGAPTLAITGQAYHGQGILKVTVGTNTVTTSDSFAHWSASIGLVEGENTLTITATSLGVPAATRTITRKVFYIPNLPANSIPDEWLIANFGSVDSPQGGADSDPDSDGQSNLAEYLFGTDPKTNDAPHFKIIRGTNGSVQVELTRRSSTNFTFTVEASPNLNSWEPVEAEVEAFSEEVPVGTFPSSVTATYRVGGTGSGVAQFYRVRAARN